MALKILHPGGAELTAHAGIIAGLKTDEKLLDIGCGTADSLCLLEELYDIIPYGIDISDTVLDLAASRHPKISLTSGNAASLPFPDDYFDAVMMECVLTLLEEPEAELREARRVLKPGGRFIISTLADTDPAHADPSVLCTGGLADPEALISYMESLGFELLVSEDRKSDLTKYMIDSIMEYGSIEERIRSESASLGCSVFECGAEYNKKTTSYYLFIFRKGGIA